MNPEFGEGFTAVEGEVADGEVARDRVRVIGCAAFCEARGKREKTHYRPLPPRDHIGAQDTMDRLRRCTPPQKQSQWTNEDSRHSPGRMRLFCDRNPGIRRDTPISRFVRHS